MEHQRCENVLRMRHIPIFTERDGGFQELSCIIPLRDFLRHAVNFVPIPRRVGISCGRKHVFVPVENKWIREKRNGKNALAPDVWVCGFDECIAKLRLRESVEWNGKHLSRITNGIILAQEKEVGARAACKRFGQFGCIPHFIFLYIRHLREAIVILRYLPNDRAERAFFKRSPDGDGPNGISGVATNDERENEDARDRKCAECCKQYCLEN